MLKGKANLTKAEYEERKKSEVKADVNNIFAPSSLRTKKQKNRFNYLAEQLMNCNIISNLDVESLARYVLLEEQYNKLTAVMNKTDMLSYQYDGLLIKQTKIFNMLDKSSNELCLNIISRCKVSVPKAEEKPVNKFSKFGSVTNG